MPKDSPNRGNRLSRVSWSMIFLFAVMFTSASRTSAHRVILFAYAEGDTVFTESYFSDGKRCQGSRIEVFDSQGNKLLEGKTDSNGEFSFKPPQKTDLKIILTASMGHKDEYTIPARELRGEAEGKSLASEPDKAAKKVFDAGNGSSPKELTPRELEQIRTVVEEALDERLRPVMRLLSKPQTEGISFVQVMGGIGIIFGIMGIILYFRSRREG
jgi:nickel transport protein